MRPIRYVSCCFRSTFPSFPTWTLSLDMSGRLGPRRQSNRFSRPGSHTFAYWTRCTSWRQSRGRRSHAGKQTVCYSACSFLHSRSALSPPSLERARIGSRQEPKHTTHRQGVEMERASEIVSKNRSRAESGFSSSLPAKCQDMHFCPLSPLPCLDAAFTKVLPHCLKPTSAPPPPTPVRLTLR